MPQQRPPAQQRPPTQQPQAYRPPPPQRPPGHPQYRQPPPYQQAPPPVVAASDVEVIEEFEAYEEEISEEEFLAEKRALRRRRVAGMAGATVMGVLAAIIVFALLFDGSILPTLYDNFEPTELESSNLVAPGIPTWDPELGDAPPTPTAGLAAEARYTITWQTTSVFVGRGGTMRVNITNSGQTDIYVKTVRLVPEWADPLAWYGTTMGRYVSPGQEVHIGLLGFSGPAAAGPYDYNFEIDLMAVRRVTSTWADLDPSSHDTFSMDVLPATPVPGYTQYMNDKDIYRKVNDLMQPGDPRVAELANEVRAGLGDSYNVYWIASLFDWALENLEYVSDPSDDDIWSPPGDTCDSEEGDCEDYSILLSSVIEHWGGNSRFYIISGHAFSAAYVGGPEMDTLAVANALNNYYGTSARYSWFKDDKGYWIILDGTSSQYVGGLPYNGVAIDNQGGWDIIDTEYLYITDIYPDYPE